MQHRKVEQLVNNKLKRYGRKQLWPNLRDKRNGQTKNKKINEQAKNISTQEKLYLPLAFAWRE